MSTTLGSERIRTNEVVPGDPRYAFSLRKRFNKRFDGKPDRFWLVRSTDDVAEALDHAVRKNLRVVAQSGGHCLEGFVSDPEVRVVIDTSLMSQVYYDEKMDALAIEAGATLGEVCRKLLLGWGVMLPAGQSPDIGVGGHVLGGAFGFFHRQHGLAVDHLYAVEVVVVDEAGKARCVTATRELSDPNRELWWAHTGCGGGNLGIVTRYFFRSPDAGGPDPREFLPKAPEYVTTFKAEWNWRDIDETSFTSLVRNYGDWCERNGDVESPAARLFSVLIIAGCDRVGATSDDHDDGIRGRLVEAGGAGFERVLGPGVLPRRVCGYGRRSGPERRV
jgi:hypothetical protein